ncbi:MAG: ferritin-like domain-containing protein [Actinomycetota bacterium]
MKPLTPAARRLLSSDLGRARVSRRDALRTGGVAVTLGALVAACGEDRGGLTEPGRVGNFPVQTDLPNYGVDQTVLLRTASSLEYLALEVYGTAAELDIVPATLAPIADEVVANHQAIAEQMVELTESVGGEPYECPNPWFMDRLVGPWLEAVSNDESSEEMAADVADFATTLENIAAAAHQSLAVLGETGEISRAHIEAATLEVRHASYMAILDNGSENYISPAILGEEVTFDERGAIQIFAIPARFNQVSQIEVRAGPPDENGVRESFLLTTPAENSFIYNELGSCSA